MYIVFLGLYTFYYLLNFCTKLIISFSSINLFINLFLTIIPTFIIVLSFLIYMKLFRSPSRFVKAILRCDVFSYTNTIFSIRKVFFAKFCIFYAYLYIFSSFYTLILHTFSVALYTKLMYDVNSKIMKTIYIERNTYHERKSCFGVLRRTGYHRDHPLVKGNL